MNMLTVLAGSCTPYLFRRSLRLSALLVTITVLLSSVAHAQIQTEKAVNREANVEAKNTASSETAVEPRKLDIDPDASLADQVETLKQAAIELNRDLLILEEDLLFPGNTQVAVFVSMNVGKFFKLDALKVKIDDKVVGSHLYTNKQVDALFRGGIQRIYVGNVKSGKHEISAFFTGRGPEGREFKRAAKLTFVKTSEPSLLEVRVIDSKRKIQPVFFIKEWQL